MFPETRSLSPSRGSGNHWCEETSLVTQAQEIHFFIYTSQELGQRQPLLLEGPRGALQRKSLGAPPHEPYSTGSIWQNYLNVRAVFYFWLIGL